MFKYTHGEYSLIRYNGCHKPSIIRHNITHTHEFTLNYRTAFWDIFHHMIICPSCRQKARWHRKFHIYSLRVFKLSCGKFRLIKIHKGTHVQCYIEHVAKHHCFWTYMEDFYRYPKACFICNKGHRMNEPSFRVWLRENRPNYLLLSHANRTKDSIIIEHYSKQCPYYQIFHKYYKYQTTPGNIRGGSCCPWDSGTLKKDTRVYNAQIMHETHGEYSCLYYKADRYKALFRHNTTKKPPHTFYMTPNNFNKGERCPQCQSYKGEKLVIRCLMKYGISRNMIIHGYRLHNNINRNHCLHLDVYIPKFNLGIEFDGEQHFHPVNWGDMSKQELQQAFSAEKHRDHTKNKYCAKHNIKLIRIGEHKTYEGKKLCRLVTKQMNKRVLSLLHSNAHQLSLF